MATITTKKKVLLLLPLYILKAHHLSPCFRESDVYQSLISEIRKVQNSKVTVSCTKLLSTKVQALLEKVRSNWGLHGLIGLTRANKRANRSRIGLEMEALGVKKVQVTAGLAHADSRSFSIGSLVLLFYFFYVWRSTVTQGGETPHRKTSAGIILSTFF